MWGMSRTWLGLSSRETQRTPRGSWAMLARAGMRMKRLRWQTIQRRAVLIRSRSWTKKVTLKFKSTKIKLRSKGWGKATTLRMKSSSGFRKLSKSCRNRKKRFWGRSRPSSLWKSRGLLTMCQMSKTQQKIPLRRSTRNLSRILFILSKSWIQRLCMSDPSWTWAWRLCSTKTWPPWSSPRCRNSNAWSTNSRQLSLWPR